MSPISAPKGAPTASRTPLELESKGARVYGQVYDCESIDGVGSLFSGEDLALIVRAEVEPLDWDESPVAPYLRALAS